MKKKLSVKEKEERKEIKRWKKQKNARKINKITFLATLPIVIIVSICVLISSLNPTYIHIYLDNTYNVKLVLNSSYEIIGIEVESEFIILESIDNLNIKEVLNLIIDTMVENNYLNQYDDMLLISVDNSNIKTQIENNINSYIDNKLDYTYIVQLITYDENLEKIANNNDLSLGKYIYINKLVEDSNNFYTISELKKLSIKDIYLKKSTH